MNENNELILRIRDLEQFKEKIERWLFAALCVATALGLAGIWGGVWLKNVSKEIEYLEKRTISLEASIDSWENKVSETITILEKNKEKYKSDLLNQVNESLVNIENLSKEKANELMKTSTSELINFLKNGRHKLSLSRLSIVNSQGVETVSLGSDSGGDGYFQINSESGLKRYITYLANDNCITTYSNKDGNAVIDIGAAENTGGGLLNVVNPKSGKIAINLYSDSNSGIRLFNSVGNEGFHMKFENDRPIAKFYDKKQRAIVGLGSFNDQNNGFLRIYNSDNDKTVAELSGNESGGRSLIFTQRGKQLVYIGPASNTGDALIKLNSRFGDNEKDIGPTK